VANWQPIISVATAVKAMLDFAVGDKPFACLRFDRTSGLL